MSDTKQSERGGPGNDTTVDASEILGERKKHWSDCAACREFEKRKRSAWNVSVFALPVFLVGLVCLAGWLWWSGTPLSEPSPIVFPIVLALVGVCLLIVITGEVIIGSVEFSFLDRKGCMHRHRAMPERLPYKEAMAGHCIANSEQFWEERVLYVRSGMRFGSLGDGFLVAGPILRLRNGGLFRKNVIIWNTDGTSKDVDDAKKRAWRIKRCWRGLDDLELESVPDGSSSTCVVKGHGTCRMLLDLLHDLPETSMFGLLCERLRLQSEAKKLEERIRELDNTSMVNVYLVRMLADMFVVLTRARESIGRSRHAKLLRGMLAAALSGRGQPWAPTVMRTEDYQRMVCDAIEHACSERIVRSAEQCIADTETCLREVDALVASAEQKQLQEQTPPAPAA
ncbi:MAG: hypothetical protein Q7T01_00245 [bacterium]|nr:hypothetical protein [bacterium]